MMPEVASGVSWYKRKVGTSQGEIIQLYHQPFCPHSRYIRLVLSGHGIDPQLIAEKVWERREEFLALNPAGTIPVLVQPLLPPVPGAALIAEYVDETCGAMLRRHRLLPVSRIAVSRCADWRLGLTRNSILR